MSISNYRWECGLIICYNGLPYYMCKPFHGAAILECWMWIGRGGGNGAGDVSEKDAETGRQEARKTLCPQPLPASSTTEIADYYPT